MSPAERAAVLHAALHVDQGCDPCADEMFAMIQGFASKEAWKKVRGRVLALHFQEFKHLDQQFKKQEMDHFEGRLDGLLGRCLA